MTRREKRWAAARERADALILRSQQLDRVAVDAYEPDLHAELTARAQDQEEVRNGREYWVNGFAGTRWTVRLERGPLPQPPESA